jgi:hypothetical protein
MSINIYLENFLFIFLFRKSRISSNFRLQISLFSFLSIYFLNSLILSAISFEILSKPWEIEELLSSSIYVYF